MTEMDWYEFIFQLQRLKSASWTWIFVSGILIIKMKWIIKQRCYLGKQYWFVDVTIKGPNLWPTALCKILHRTELDLKAVNILRSQRDSAYQVCWKGALKVLFSCIAQQNMDLYRLKNLFETCWLTIFLPEFPLFCDAKRFLCVQSLDNGAALKWSSR